MSEFKPEVHALETAAYTEPVTLQGRHNYRGKKRLAYYDNLPEATLERFAGFLSDEDYLSLEQEIATARALFQHMVDDWTQFSESFNMQTYLDSGETPPKPPYSIRDLMSALETISKLLEKQQKLMFGDSNTITVEAAMAFVLSVGQLVSMFVSSVDERKQIFDGMRLILTKGKSFDINVNVARRLLGPEGE